MRRFVLALILVVVPSAVVAQDYAEVKTPDFTVVTDLGEAKGHEFAEHFEQVRAAFGIFFNKEAMTVPVPVTFVAFKDPRDFQQFVPKPSDKLHPMWPGTVRSGEYENLIAFDTTAEGRRPNAPLSGLEFADREYVRLLINGNFPPVPAWYEDGILEYCAALRVTNKQIIYGLPQPDLMAVLRTQPWLRVVQLFGPLRTPLPEDWDALRETTYYAQSWITIDYLMASRLGAQLNSFVDMVQNRKMDVQEAIRRAYAVEPQAFENAVRNYFTMNPVDYKLTLPADFAKSTIESRRVRASDWLTTLAALHSHSSREHEAGTALYTRVLAQDANNAAAHRGLGYSYLQHNQFEEAEAHLQKALAADPGDARTQYLFALAAYRKSRVTDSKPDLASMKQHLQKAVELDPHYADAYQLLSWVESELKDTDGAYAAIQKASDLSPRNDLYALTAAQFDMQAKRYDKARPVLERLQGSDQPEVARFAHQALANIDKPAESSATSSYSAREQITAPQWREKQPEATAQPEAVAKAAPAGPAKPQKIEYMKGELVAVDCSHPPMVSMTFAAKGKRWTMFSTDVHKLMLIGVENFSCDWTNQKASVNYKMQPDGRGELVTLEID